MRKEKNSPVGLVIILGLLAMLMPLSIDMYLPAMPQIAREFAVSAGSVQMTLNLYILGFAIGQLVYGPLADSYGRKPVIVLGTLIFACAAAACALSQIIDQLIFMRFLHGLSAAAASVVINALMRDTYSKEDFSRMMSFVMLVTTIAPLLAPIIGGWLLLLWNWHAIFWTLAGAALITTVLVVTQIRETLKPEQRQRFHLRTTMSNFVALVRHKRAFSYMLASGFSFAGLFTFLNAGPFVYIEVNHVSPQNFGYYFGLNVVFLFVMTLINSRAVRRFGPLKMFRLGLVIQFAMGVWLLISSALDLGFLSLVFGVAMFIGCVSTVSSNAMAVILDEFPHMAGTASSLAGTLRFGVGALVGALLSLVSINSAWPMVATIALCATVSIVLFTYASRPHHSV
ncbi:Bcr/CflA family multidrug efflux MFS transporter [Candidatus Pantoea floridensis]|uniref:Bcr/CflA family efflux transporter n=1 Tax=Candidatus Pantoea floridensis TaxID=1938870 RepID=A0A286BX79_9GAMM|nr:Bcr/CflA family multidrug efflux MFS transporter [Pantoea floridensis]PIF21244.1 DHA1 family bicyclomycin/chloramphenicol resistance-like MFS transporter [Enterobacteriaceae bacterium JKS000233]SOD38756.1 MFS transporter, DHA1 family, bicyclomycin/chloramphenicol resistance protein [Pantoea floridensis]